MKMQVFDDPYSVAWEAAKFVAERAKNRVKHTGQFTIAVSGGSTPWQMLQQLTELPFPWEHTHWFQVDERVAPRGDEARNLTQMQRALLERVNIPEGMLHPMPVEMDDLELGAIEYAQLLGDITGHPATLDLVHLGMGGDGHTASLIPEDTVLDVDDVDVAATGQPYQGHLRMTLTFPIINRAREVLWLMTGASKQEMLARLLNGDESIPAGRIESNQAVIFADQGAASGLG